MKKLFVMLLALTVLGLPAFAQVSKRPMTRSRELSRAVLKAINKHPEKVETVIMNLQTFRNTTEKRKEFNGSYSLQDMMGLMDSYLVLYKESAQTAFLLNEEINKPIKAGWGKTVTVRQLIRDNIQHVAAGSSTAENLETFEGLLGKTPKVEVVEYVKKTVAAAPQYADKAAVKAEANKVFAAYFAKNPAGKVQETAYKPLAELLTAAVSLNQMIARTDSDRKADFAIQAFFSDDIPGKYAALKAVNPGLANATNKLMKSFMGTVSNGTFYGSEDHADMKTMRVFKQSIGYK